MKFKLFFSNIVFPLASVEERQAEIDRKIRNSGVVTLKLVWNATILK